MIESAFIDDDYEREGYISRRPGLHPAVKFSFRPMLMTERSRMLTEQNRAKTPEESETLAAKEIARRIKWWDIENRNGKEVGITPENVIRLQPRVFVSMFSQVIGSEGPDPTPELDNLDEIKTEKEREEDSDAKN